MLQLKYKKTNVSMLVGIFLTLLVVLPVMACLFWQPYDPNEIDYSSMLKAPSLSHIFGTDDYGRDIFSRVMNGAAITFAISLFTVAAGAAIGTLVGALTGYFGGIADEILMRINDCLASFPSILLALVVVSLLDKGTWNICIALGLVFIPSFARIMRAEFIKERSRDYVLNARLMGAGNLRVIFVHIFPNTLPILFSSMLVGFNNAVLAEAGLSYLGLGVQPPEPSLGRMLSEAKTYIFGAPWYELCTCLVMIVFILGITIISENLGVSGVNLAHVKRRIERLRQDAFHDGNALEKDSHPILSVNGLEVGFVESEGLEEAIHGISFDLRRGEILGVVGESGSGKSLTAMSIMGILSDKAVITGGNILLNTEGLSQKSKTDGEIKPDENGYVDLTRLPEKDYRRLRGGRLAYVFQEPMTSLNPVQRIGVQIDEVLDIHASDIPEEEQKKLVLEAMKDTGLHEVEKLYNMYPHELSGGMRQRVIIAMALVARADIIIADEPTTALDANVAEVILDIFKNINVKYGTSIIIISHDLRVIGRLADRALIMHNGAIAETIEVLQSRKLFSEPATEYGKRLLNAAFSTKAYTEETKTDSREAIVTLKNVSVYYKNRKRSEQKLNKVIDNVSLNIYKGQTTGFVGESGCGKTTLVKAIAGLQRYVEGEIQLNCRQPAMVFQDPYSSLNPAFTVERILREPLILQNRGAGDGALTREQMHEKVIAMLKATELAPELAGRRVHELSGGQRQRIAIALTLILRRELIILDEPVSALDVTIQEQILELLMRLKKEFGLTYILISHDERLVARICDRVYNVKNGHCT